MIGEEDFRHSWRWRGGHSVWFGISCRSLRQDLQRHITKFEEIDNDEDTRKQAIDAIRKFVDQVSADLPDESRRKNVIDAALDLTEELVTGRIEFFRSVVRSAGQAVGGKQS